MATKQKTKNTLGKVNPKTRRIGKSNSFVDLITGLASVGIAILLTFVSLVLVYWLTAYWPHILINGFDYYPSIEYLAVRTTAFSFTAFVLSLVAVLLGGKRLQFTVYAYSMVGGVLLSIREHGIELFGRLPEIPTFPAQGPTKVQSLFLLAPTSPKTPVILLFALISIVVFVLLVSWFRFLTSNYANPRFRQFFYPARNPFPWTTAVINAYFVTAWMLLPAWAIGYGISQTDFATRPLLKWDLPVTRELTVYIPPAFFTGLLVLTFIAFLCLNFFGLGLRDRSAFFAMWLFAVGIRILQLLSAESFSESEEATMRHYLSPGIPVEYCSSSSFIYEGEQYTFAAMKDPSGKYLPGDVCTDVGIFLNGDYLQSIALPNTEYFTNLHLENMANNVSVWTNETLVVLTPTSEGGLPQGDSSNFELSIAEVFSILG